MNRVLEAFSPMRKATGTTPIKPSPSWARPPAVPESPSARGFDAATEGAMELLSSLTDEQRVDALRKGSLVRIENCRDFFHSLLQLEDSPTDPLPKTTEDFVASLADGTFIVLLLLKINGMVEKPNRLAGLGSAGITAENFDR